MQSDDIQSLLTINEELLHREREKTALLSLGEDMATIRNRHDLWRAMMEKIKPMLGFDDAVVIVYTADRLFCTHLLTASSPERQANKRYSAVVGQPLVLAGTPIDYLMKRPGNFTWYTDEVAAINPAYAAYPGIKLMQETGLTYTWHAKLRWGGSDIGMFHLHFKAEKQLTEPIQNLYQTIVQQVTVAVSNILANEELLEREQRTTRQIGLVNELTQGANWSDRFLGITRSLQTFLALDHLYFLLRIDNTVHDEHAYYRIGPDDYQVVDEAAFCRMANLSPDRYMALRQPMVFPLPLLLNGDAYRTYLRDHPLQQEISRIFGLQATLIVPLPLAPNQELLVAIASKRPDAYLPAHLTELRLLLAAISPTIEKLLAFEEVNRLKDQLQQQKAYLMEEVQSGHNFAEIIGSSPALRDVLRAVEQVAPTDTTVLIEGETGTGKELIARAVHNHSPRRAHPLIKVNCAALPPQLIESELFGHEKGAFTGAHDRRIGKFELAHQGTLFLDEVGELPLELQPKLLRALQEREIERLGGRQVIKTDVRVVAATNRDLRQEVAAGRFRADLYYRLSVFPVKLPALRDRREDILPLAQSFIHKFSQKLGKSFQGLSAESVQQALRYHWPGNIRELQNVLEQAVITSPGPALDCTRYFRDQPAPAPQPTALLTTHWLTDMGELTLDKLDALKDDLERRFLLQVLEQAGGRVRGVGGAAELLNASPTTLDSRLKKLGIGMVRTRVK